MMSKIYIHGNQLQCFSFVLFRVIFQNYGNLSGVIFVQMNFKLVKLSASPIFQNKKGSSSQISTKSIRTVRL